MTPDLNTVISPWEWPWSQDVFSPGLTLSTIKILPKGPEERKIRVNTGILWATETTSDGCMRLIPSAEGSVEPDSGCQGFPFVVEGCHVKTYYSDRHNQ